jgi:hypothetical protein
MTDITKQQIDSMEFSKCCFIHLCTSMRIYKYSLVSCAAYLDNKSWDVELELRSRQGKRYLQRYYIAQGAAIQYFIDSLEQNFQQKLEILAIQPKETA